MISTVEWMNGGPLALLILDIGYTVKRSNFIGKVKDSLIGIALIHIEQYISRHVYCTHGILQ